MALFLPLALCFCLAYLQLFPRPILLPRDSWLLPLLNYIFVSASAIDENALFLNLQHMLPGTHGKAAMNTTLHDHCQCLLLFPDDSNLFVSQSRKRR